MSSAINLKSDVLLKDQEGQDQDLCVLNPVAQLIQEGLFLDKTMAIKKLYDGTPSRCDLIVRPRGFGKTIFADTLEALFTHDFETLKGTQVVGQWQEPYVQVVRLDMAKISDIERDNYPYYSQDDNGNDIMPVSSLNHSTKGSAKRSDNQSKDDLYTFNSDLYTMLFEQLTQGSQSATTVREESVAALGDGQDGALEDFGAMISATNERSSMGQIHQLLSRCQPHSRVLIIENIDAPLLSSLHRPRLYNYRSRVLITFLNLVGYYRKAFRHIIVLGTTAIDYRQGKDEYPQFMAYLPLTVQSGMSREFGQLLGFSHEDLLNPQFAKYLDRACHNFNIQRKEKEPLAPELSKAKFVEFIEHKYGGYSFDKLSVMCNTSAIYSLFKYGIDKHTMLNSLNFEYFKKSCRVNEMEMLFALMFLLMSRFIIIGEYCILPVLINDEDIVDIDAPKDKVEAASKNEVVDKVKASEAVVLSEGSTESVNAVANEFESIAQLRRLNDEEIVAQGMRGVPLPVFFWALGYMSSYRINKDNELVSTMPNIKVYDHVVTAIKQRYFTDKTIEELSFKLDDTFFFPVDSKKLKNYFSKLVRGMKLYKFKEEADSDLFKILLSIWLVMQNKNSMAKSLGLELPTVAQAMRHKLETEQQANLDKVLDGPINSLESALFNAQEQNIKLFASQGSQAFKEGIASLIAEDSKLKEGEDQNSQLSSATVVLDEEQDNPESTTIAHKDSDSHKESAHGRRASTAENLEEAATNQSQESAQRAAVSEDLSANFDELLGTLSELVAQGDSDTKVAPKDQAVSSQSLKQEGTELGSKLDERQVMRQRRLQLANLDAVSCDDELNDSELVGISAGLKDDEELFGSENDEKPTAVALDKKQHKPFKRTKPYNDKLNDFNNMVVEPKGEPTIRLRMNLQDMDRKSANRLWKNLQAVAESIPKLSHEDAMKNYEVNAKIILDYRPYIEPHAQFKVLSTSRDSLQKREHLQYLAVYSYDVGCVEVAKQCEELLDKLPSELPDDPDFAKGKDISSILMSQAQLIIENKSVLEANYLLLDILDRAKECCLLNTSSKLMAQVEQIKDQFLATNYTDREIILRVDLETVDNLNKSFKERAQAFIVLPDSIIKTFMLRRLAFLAELAGDMSSARYILCEADKTRDMMVSTMLGDSNSCFDPESPQGIVSSALERAIMSITRAKNNEEEDEHKSIRNPMSSYKLNGESIGDSLSESEQLLLLLNHTSMIANGQYLTGSLSDHCNLTIYNEDEALIFELGLIKHPDELAHVVKGNYKALLNVRNPLEHLLDPSEQTLEHYNTVSLIAAINSKSCSLKDFTIVTDSNDTHEESASAKVIGSSQYYPTILRFLNNFLVFDDIYNGRLKAEEVGATQEQMLNHKEFIKHLMSFDWGHVFDCVESKPKAKRQRSMGHNKPAPKSKSKLVAK